MSRIAYVDGVYQPIDMPGIHVEDRGYQFADGVYEVCAVHNARPVDEEAHLDRLERSLAELGIAAPMSRAAMKIVVRETLARNRIRNGIVYMQVTRGVASREHNYPAGLKPVLVVTARHTDPARRASVLRDGISVVTCRINAGRVAISSRFPCCPMCWRGKRRKTGACRRRGKWMRTGW